MIKLDNDHLLFIEPEHDKSEEPVIDDLSKGLFFVFNTQAEPNDDATRGFHRCKCGATSRNITFTMPDGRITNSLNVHYLIWHRDEVPESELEKVREYLENGEVKKYVES